MDDRVVIGIRNEPTRRHPFQQKKRALNDDIDACKASEATSHRLRVMSGAGGEVKLLIRLFAE